MQVTRSGKIEDAVIEQARRIAEAKGREHAEVFLKRLGLAPVQIRAILGASHVAA